MYGFFFRSNISIIFHDQETADPRFFGNEKSLHSWKCWERFSCTSKNRYEPCKGVLRILFQAFLPLSEEEFLNTIRYRTGLKKKIPGVIQPESECTATKEIFFVLSFLLSVCLRSLGSVPKLFYPLSKKFSILLTLVPMSFQSTLTTGDHFCLKVVGIYPHLSFHCGFQMLTDTKAFAMCRSNKETDQRKKNVEDINRYLNPSSLSLIPSHDSSHFSHCLTLLRPFSSRIWAAKGQLHGFLAMTKATSTN